MIDVMIADDNIEFSTSLCNMVTKEKDIKIVNISTNGLETLASYTSLNPDVLILDLNIPILSGIDFLNSIDNEDTKSNIIIISGSNEYKNLLTNVSKIRYIFHKPFDFDYNSNKLLEIIREIKKDSPSEEELDTELYKLLDFLNFNMCSKGTILLMQAIKLAYFNPKLIFKTENLMKELSITYKYTNFKSIRSTIDKSIYSMYENNMDLKKICIVFPNFYGYKPTIKNFISNSVNYLNNKF